MKELFAIGKPSEWIPRTKVATLLAGLTCAVFMSACVRLANHVSHNVQPLPKAAICQTASATCN